MSFKVLAPLRIAAAAAMLTIGACILAISLSSTGNAAHKDFIAYWAAGRILLSRGNPYDESAVLQLQRSVGFLEHDPLMVRNPPHALLLCLPLGLGKPTFAAIIWSLLIIGSLLASIRILRSLHGQHEERWHLLGYVFAPSLACVQYGQTSLFVLLGLALFLYFVERRPSVSGLCMPLIALKPHLFVPFTLVFLYWVIRKRQYSALAASIASTSVALLIPTLLAPGVLPGYLGILRAAQTDSALLPTLSSLIRSLNPRWPLLQFTPVLVGGAWAAWYFKRHEPSWIWLRHGQLLLLVSVVTAPYAWFFDEAVLLPAVFGAFAHASETNRLLTPFGIIDGLALVLVMVGIPLSSGAYLWTPWAWLMWYMLLSRKSRLGGHAHPTATLTSARELTSYL